MDKLIEIIDYTFGKNTSSLDFVFNDKDAMAIFILSFEKKLKDNGDDQVCVIEFMLRHCTPSKILTENDRKVALSPLFLDWNEKNVDLKNKINKGIYSLIFNYGYYGSDGKLFMISRPLSKAVYLNAEDLKKALALADLQE